MQLPGAPPSFFEEHWGDIASVVGLIISIVGFIVTIRNVKRSKTAAQRAEEAATQTRDAIIRAETIIDFSAALTIMDEIKRLHRAGAWNYLPDRYSTLRKMLISIRTANITLSVQHQTALQGAIQHFSNIERRIERALISNSAKPDAAKLNAIVSTQIDKLSEVLTAIRQQIGVDHNG